MVSSSGDLRVRLASALDSVVEDKLLKELIVDALDATKPRYAEVACKHCSRKQRVEVPVPDPVQRAKALEILVNQAKGTPKATSVLRVDVSARSLVELSDEQLGAIVSGGSFPELPPAA